MTHASPTTQHHSAASAAFAVDDAEAERTAATFERVFGDEPGRVRHVPGALTLLGDGRGYALTLGLPWGVLCAVGEGTPEIRSMNHDPGRYRPAAGEAAPEWAAPALAALHAHDAPEARIVLNHELPLGMGLFSGGETYSAVSLALQDLNGTEASITCGASSDPGHLTASHARPGKALLVQGGGMESLPCDLAGAGLRLLVMDLGVERMLPRADGRLLVLTAASALRSGDLAAFGVLLSEGHIRGEFVFDLALDTAQEAGALGGLVVGRCLVTLAPATAVPRVRDSVKAMLNGLAARPPRFLTAVPSGPRAVHAGI
jgi:galactokinase